MIVVSSAQNEASMLYDVRRGFLLTLHTRLCWSTFPVSLEQVKAEEQR